MSDYVMDTETAIKYMRSIRQTPANWILEYDAIDKAIEALELMIGLEKELPIFKHILDIQYEIFNKYDLYNHTEIEQIAFDEFSNTVQELQWLIGRLESNDND